MHKNEFKEPWSVIKRQANRANHKSNLVTLCKDCHKSVTEISDQPQYFNQKPKYNPWDGFDRNDTISFIPENYQYPK